MIYEVKLMYGETVNNSAVCKSKAEVRYQMDWWRKVYGVRIYQKCSIQIYPIPTKDIQLNAA